jgi:hypothetical protein
VLNLNNVINPPEAHPRALDTSYDLTFAKDSTVKSRIWTKYEKYTRKFSMTLLYAKSDTAGTGSNLFTKAYGVYSSNWIGFKQTLKRLHVLNANK